MARGREGAGTALGVEITPLGLREGPHRTKHNGGYHVLSYNVLTLLSWPFDGTFTLPSYRRVVSLEDISGRHTGHQIY